MADDVNANIRIDLDTSDAVVALRNLQAQISSFNQSVIKSNASAVAAQQSMLSTLTAQIGASRQFTTSMVNVETSVSKLGRAIDKNKLSLGEYFRYGAASSRTFGRMFGREHTAVMELAADRVKRLQTQYIAMGEAQNGVTRAMAIRPVSLFNADMAVGIQRQQIFNKLLRDGSTSLVNWGKNTQWAGRQLMVGFTVPLTIFGGIAGQVFMDLERQIVNFRRVYGDATTPLEETNGMIEQIKELGSEFTKYGIAVKDTITLAADAAAAGAQGSDLLAQTEQATRLATLGMMEQQQALTATIALQSAFGLSAKELGESIDFLNAVENQTVLSLQDVAEAIPRVAPIIKGLGGDVQDLAIFLAAMREGGINAAEGSNALKSGLASLINPTKGAREQLQKVGIDIDKILSTNKGDLRATVMEFGAALSTLNDFQRQQTLAKVFGKFQFARLGALFENINRQGSQAQRVIDLTGESFVELNALAEKELGAISDSVGVKFTGAMERLRLAIAPIGEAFLKVATPIIEFATRILEKFNELSPSAKNIAIVLATGLGVVVPAVTMLIGLFANFAGQAIKSIAIFGNFFKRIRGGGAALSYLSEEQLDAIATSTALEGKVDNLTRSLNLQRSAVINLGRSYSNYVRAAGIAATNLPQGFRTRPIRGMAKGGIVPGSGNKDTIPALLTPGESVITKEATQKFGPILEAMNSGNIPGFYGGQIDIGGGQTFSIEVFDRRSEAAIQTMFDKAADLGEDVKNSFLRILTSVKEAQDVAVQTGNDLKAQAKDIRRMVVEEGLPSKILPGGKTHKASGAGIRTTVEKDIARLPGITQEQAQAEFQRALAAARGAENSINEYYDQLIRNAGDDAAQITELEAARARAVGQAQQISRAHAVQVTNLEKTFREGWAPELWLAQSQIENELSKMFAESDQRREVYERHLREIVTDTDQADVIMGKITANLALTDDELQIQARVLRQILATSQSMAQMSPAFAPYALGTIGAAEARAAMPASTYFAAGNMAARESERAAAVTAKNAAVQSWKETWQIASPSEQGAEVGENINRGVAEGLRRSTPMVAAAAAQSSKQTLAAMRSAAGEQLDLFNQPPIDPQMALFPEEQFRVERRQVPPGDLGMGGGDGPAGPVFLGMPGMPERGGKPGGGIDTDGMDKAEKSAGRLSSRLFAVSMGATTVAGGLSMMDNKVGETARNMLPLVAALDAASMGMLLFQGKGGKVMNFLKGFGKPFAAIGTAIAGLVSRIPFIGKLGAAFSKLGGVISKVAAVFMKFSGLGKVVAIFAKFAAFLGPQGIILGIVALGAAMFAVYQKFEEFRNAVAAIGSALVELFEMIFGPADELGQKMSSIGSIISSVWNGLLKALLPIFMAIAKVIEIVIKSVTLLVFFFKQAVNWISINFPKAADGILNSLGPVGDFLRNLGSQVANVFRAIPGAISNAWKSVVKTVVGAVNFIIDKINMLIDAANLLGAGLQRIANINLGGPRGGAIAATARQRRRERREAEREAIRRGNAAAAARYQAQADAAAQEPEDFDFTEEEAGAGAGEKEKTFLEELADNVAANYRLFVENVKKSGKSAMDSLRAIRPPIPEQILAMIGAGPEGLENAKEFLNADAKRRKALIARWTKATIGQTLSDLQSRREAKRQESTARNRLQTRGVEKDLVEEILQDENAILTVVSGTKAEVDELIAGYRELQTEQDPVKKAVEDIKKQHEETVKIIDEQIEAQQEVINAIEDQIAALEDKNAEDQWAIRNKEREKELIDRQIEALERANEMDERRIDALQRQDELRNRESEALSRELEQLSLVEEQIRQTYQDRIEALDKVAEINSFIVNQQKQQLGLSQALAQGDIFAATAAAQEMRQSQADFAQQQARAGLEQGMENAVAGLVTAGGLTREQAEKQIANIKEQSYQTSLLIRDIEDQIFARNEQIVPLKDQQYQIDLQIRDIADRIFERETEIYNIREQQLEPQQEILNNLNDQKAELQKITDETINQIEALAEQAEAAKDVTGQVDNIAAAWFEVQKAIKRANELAKQQSNSLIEPVRRQGETDISYADRMERVAEQRRQIEAQRQATVNSALARGRAAMGMYAGGRVNYKGSNEPPPAQMMGGGKVKKYPMGGLIPYADGGKVFGRGGMDSVNAMLTPGEFVVRKAMVDKYGIPMLNALNQGAFGMPKYKVDETTTGNVTVRSQNTSNIMAPMYNNYSVNVSVSNTNASADEIANRTIMKIKQMQDMQIRSSRGY